MSPLTPPSSPKPIILFIPGAFHTAAHFGPLSDHLTHSGYENFAITLPSTMSGASNNVDTTISQGGSIKDDDVTAIRRLLETLVRNDDEMDEESNGGIRKRDGKSKRGDIRPDTGGNDVVLVMHSSGAVSGCQAIASLERTRRMKEGKKGGVVGLVLIGGLLANEGESLASTMVAMGQEALPKYTKSEVGKSTNMCESRRQSLTCKQGTVLHPSNISSTIYHDLPPSHASYWSSKLTSLSLDSYTTIVQNTCWDLDIPTTYILGTKDPEVEMKKAMIEKMNKAGKWDIRTIEAGHSPFLSHEMEVGDLIVGAASVGDR